MRVTRIATSVLVATVCVAFASAVWGESLPLRAKEVAERKVEVKTNVQYDKMTAMGRLAYVYRNAVKQLPATGKGQSFKAVIKSASKPNDCIGADEDCSNEGFSEGPSGGQAELAIAVDISGTKIVIGFNDTRGFSLNPISVSGFARSSDGGATFVDGGQLPTTANGHVGATMLPQVFGDADVKYLPGGAGCQFIYSSMGVIGLGAPPNFTGSAQTMVIHRSTDCGATWSGPFEIAPATNPTGVILISGNARDAADKEFIDVDPETGRVLISWSNFTSSSVIPGFVQISTTFSDNVMTATPPTWSSRVVLNPGSGTFDTGSMPRFAGNGSNNAYVTYSTSSLVAFAQNVKVSRSTDNGVTWSVPIALGPDFFTIDYIIGNDRVHSFPSISVDTTSGPNSGNVYVVAAGNNNDDGADILFWKSTDGGVSFSPGIYVNARPGADRSQWFPTIAVDKTTGRVNVMWDDQGPASSGDAMEMTWIYSDDGGTTWSKPSPLVARPFHGGFGNDTGQPNLGDYNMLVAQNGTLYAAFTTTPDVSSFVNGEPTSGSFSYPSFLSGGTPSNPPGFAKVTAGQAALQLGAISYTDSGGNGLVDAGDQVRYTIPLFNYVTNPAIGTVTYTGVSGVLSTTTPGVSILSGNVTYPNIGPGSTQNNNPVFVVQVAPNFPPGTRIEFSLALTTGQGNRTLLFSQNTGTPVTTTIFSEDFNGVSPGTLPAGWSAVHAGGNNTVRWTTNNSFCGTGSNGLFHQNANDGLSGDHTRFERAFSPVFSVPSSEYVTLDFDICYDTEDDPNFNVLAYDGVVLRITDQTTGHILRSVFLEAFAEPFITGTSNNFPKHGPRSSNGNYFQDLSMWAGDSGGFKHVSLRLPGMTSTAAQLRWEFTQDSGGTCTDVRPTHTTCGVIVDNVVMKSVTTKSDELKVLTLRPVSGQVGTYTGQVTSQAIAGPGGIVVNLTSDHPLQTTISPSTVTIPSGSQISPTFTAATTLVGTKIIITATGPSNIRTGAILVTQ